MQLIRGLNRWRDTSETVVTIGNFDGVHRGHQTMFEQVLVAARSHRLPATVISFEPLPHEFFTQPKAPNRLQGLRDRIQTICASGMDRLLLLTFDQTLAAQSAQEFIEKVLVDTLRIRHVMVGDDFRFGHNRQGNIAMLQAAASSHGFTLQQSPTLVDGGERISSTRIRQHLLAGELAAAAELLGRPYRISGRIVHGEKVGRQLGFPTANVALGHHRPPLRGVFAVQVHHAETGRCLPAVANLGERPTVGGRRLLLEVHILEQIVDIYGQHLNVDFITRLRPERRFDSLDELKAQISRDAAAAQELLIRR